MFSYFGYGLSIRSHFQLSELPTTGTSAEDVSIKVGHFYSAPSNGRGRIDRDQTFWCYVPGAGKFLVPSEREIVVCPIPDVEEQLLVHCILGVRCSMLLHRAQSFNSSCKRRRNQWESHCLPWRLRWWQIHNGGSLQSLGYNIVADDVLCVDFKGETNLSILPGFPFLKLHYQSASILADRVESLPRVHSMDPRFIYRQSEGFSFEPIPLGCIYLLGRGKKIRGGTYDTQEGFQAIISHSQASGLVKDTVKEALHFRAVRRGGCGCALASTQKRPYTFNYFEGYGCNTTGP